MKSKSVFVVLLAVLSLGLFIIPAVLPAQPTNGTEQSKIAVPYPAYGAVYLEEFVGEIDFGGVNDSVWVITSTGTASAVTYEDSMVQGGAVLLSLDSTGGAGYSEIELQYGQPTWRMEAGKDLVFEARVVPGAVLTHEYFVGLSQLNTAIADSIIKGVGFTVEGDSNILFISNDGLTQSADSSDTGVDFADSTGVTFRIWYDGNDRTRFYVNNNYVGQVTGTASRPDSIWMAPVITIEQNGLAGQLHDLWADYVYLQIER